jgi:Flp pilus assembly protein TadG
MRYRARGQSLVEFALVLPILILFIMGIIDFSYYIYTYSELENATRRASEYMSKAARDSCQAEAKQAAITGTVFTELTTAQISISSVSDLGPGDTVTVSVNNYPIQFLTPVGNGLFGGARFNFTSNRIILSIQPPYSGAC